MQRISTLDSRIWQDNNFDKLHCNSKYLLIYLLTNHLVNISGVYEIPLTVICYYTKLDIINVARALKELEKYKLIFYKEGFVYIKDYYEKFQQKGKKISPKILKGIDNQFKKIPQNILNLFNIEINNDSNFIPIKRSKLSSTLRLKILQRDNFKCVLCGRTKNEDILEIDHIISVSKGGNNNINNLQTICMTCHNGKTAVENSKNVT